MEEALADVPEGKYEGEKFRLSISDTVLEKPDEDYKAEIDAVVDAFKATKSKQYVVAHTVKTPSRRHARQGPQRGRGVHDPRHLGNLAFPCHARLSAGLAHK